MLTVQGPKETRGREDWDVLAKITFYNWRCCHHRAGKLLQRRWKIVDCDVLFQEAKIDLGGRCANIPPTQIVLAESKFLCV